MSQLQEQYRTAREAGYTDAEILKHLETHKKYGPQLQQARSGGHSDQDIIDYLYTPAPQEEEIGTLHQGARLAGQAGLGALEARTFMYDLPAASLAQEEAQIVRNREELFDDIERLSFQKQTGVWDEQDQKQLDHLTELAKDPEAMRQFIQPMDITTRGLIQKATGFDPEAKNFGEKAAHWWGFIKQPQKWGQLAKQASKEGISLPQVTKSIAKALTPGREALRAAGAGAALQMAEDEHFGPMGTLAAAIVGDVAGFGAGSFMKAAFNPRDTIAKIIASTATRDNSKRAIIKDMVKTSKEMGVPLDAGSLTGSDLVKSMQTRLRQSGITGSALDDLRDQMSRSIVREYEKLADEVGAMRFDADFQAVDAIKEALGEDLLASADPLNFEREAVLSRLSSDSFGSSREGGESVLDAIREAKKYLKDQERERWSAWEAKTGDYAKEQPDLARFLGDFVKNNKKSLIFGSSNPEAKVVADAQKLFHALEAPSLYKQAREIDKELVDAMVAQAKKTPNVTDIIGNLTNKFSKDRWDRLYKAFDNNLTDLVESIIEKRTASKPKPVSIKQLRATKASLADLADWEFQGSDFSSAYKSLVQNVDNAIESTLGNVSESMAREYRDLKKMTKSFKEIYDTRDIRDLLKPSNRNRHVGNYNRILDNPDLMRNIVDLLSVTKENQLVSNNLLRDYAKKNLKQGIENRGISDLLYVLGDELKPEIDAFVEAEQYLKRFPQTSRKPATMKGSVPEKQRALLQELLSKGDKEVMQYMSDPRRLVKMHNVLSGTTQGRQVWNDLSRYKLEDMIGRKMQQSAEHQLKFGTFAKLGSSRTEKEILKTLMGKEALAKMQRLQKLSDQLNMSASKFFNASQSGSAAIDAGMMSAAVLSILSGNPWLATKATGALGGSWYMTRLLANPKFLAALEKEVTKGSRMDVNAAIKRLAPIVAKSLYDEDANKRRGAE